jgi:anti-sigma regulatory factor (Ser/Thr protein kinase)
MNAIHPALTGVRLVDGPVPVVAVLCGPCGDSVAWQLPADPLSVPQARALCREAALRWAVRTEAAQDAEIVVSELVTNAVLHGRPPIFLQFGHASAELVAAVYDAGTNMPAPLDPRWADPGRDVTGRGLALMSGCAGRWAVTRCSPGKIVTAWLTVEPVDAGPNPDTGQRPATVTRPAAAEFLHVPEGYS